MKKLVIFFALIISLSVSGQIPSIGGMMISSGTISNGLLNGLISCWGLDETSGTTAYDSYGTNDGGISGATINQTGIIDKCYSLDGISDYIAIPYSTDFNFTDEMTVSAWFKSTDTALNRGIVSNGNSYAFILYYAQSAGEVHFNVRTASGVSSANPSSSVSPPPYDGTWHLAVGVYDRNEVSGNRVKIYYDGQLITSSVGYDEPMITNTNDINIGYWTSYMNTDIDQTAIWNRALTDTEVSALYNSGAGIPYIDFTTGISYKILWDSILERKYNIQSLYKIAS